MAKLIGILVFAAATALPVLAQHGTGLHERQAKGIWQWSAEQRIVPRLDASQVRARALAADAMRHNSSPGGIASQVFALPAMDDLFVVDGARNPELLMPSELFLSLLTNAASEEDRKRFEGKLVAFGWDADRFWRTLDEASAPFRRLSEESLALQRSYPDLSPAEARQVRERVDSLEIPQCRARFDALQDMRERYAGNFDRFLYTAVAPSVRVSSTRPGPEESFRLLFIEGGCQ